MKKIVLTDIEVLGLHKALSSLKCKEVFETIKIAKNVMILQPFVDAIQKTIRGVKFETEGDLIEALKSENEYSLIEFDITKLESLEVEQALNLTKLCQFPQD